MPVWRDGPEKDSLTKEGEVAGEMWGEGWGGALIGGWGGWGAVIPPSSGQEKHTLLRTSPVNLA